VRPADGVDHSQLAIIDDTEGDDAMFTIVAAIIGSFQNRAVEDADGVLEVDSVFRDVGGILGGVPFEDHRCMDGLYIHMRAQSSTAWVTEGAEDWRRGFFYGVGGMRAIEILQRRKLASE
jgi:hypothetical protein